MYPAGARGFSITVTLPGDSSRIFPADQLLSVFPEGMHALRQAFMGD
ncbi:MAG: hypothetical protein IJ083_05755 [Clostridia bacterium]|nr:hypothetical protein [Clostridia bacterium]